MPPPPRMPTLTDGMVTLRAHRPDLRLFGVQAASCAPFAGGTQFGYTIAEGIAVKYPGELPRACSATSSSRS